MINASIERCAGIDVGKKMLAVCIMVGPIEGEPRVETRPFGTHRRELERLREWLKQEQITHVVMESTGSYWKPVYNVLEGDMKVYLANPQEVKNRRGHKTDNKDGWWLAHLLRHAMIHPSFIPPRKVRELRDLTRRRKKMVGAATAERNRIQKVLEDANVKLCNVLSDLFGVSGQRMLSALLEGKATPVEIADLATGQLKNRIQEIWEALDGHQMSDHHRLMIQFSVKHLQFLEQQIAELDKAIVEKIEEAGLKEDCERLQSIPGIRQTSAVTIIAETGNDMKQFPSEGKFSSWAGLCPGNNRSAGRNKGSRTTRGNPWLRSALTECAWAAASKNGCFLKGKFWRIVTKKDGKKAPALIAVAHMLLIFVYRVLDSGQPYQERGAPPMPDQQKRRLIRHHLRRLGKLGIAVSTAPPQPPMADTGRRTQRAGR
jgi:transposase